MQRAIAIAIDGPAGAGKSTVSKALAELTGFALLDTGAMYRSYAWAVLQRPGLDSAEWDAELDRHVFRSEWVSGITRVWCDQVEITEAIRQADVTSFVSAIAAVPEIRRRAVLSQRQYVDKAKSAGQGVILEGRDIGTTVLPDAELKIFLTADPIRRAERRAAEIGQDLAATAAAIKSRDDADSSREVSPLQQAADAVVVDATELNVGEVVAAIVAAIEALP